MSSIPQSDLPRLDQFDFHHRLDETGGTVLVMFGSPACGGCRHLRRILGEVNRNQPDWQVFEVDVQADPGLAGEFGVFHLPTLFLYSRGTYHGELRAEARVSSIESATREALVQPPQEAP